MQASRKKGEGAGWTINLGYKRCTQRGPNYMRYEHVLVMEETLGRRLDSGEVVHHVNGDKLDNRIENLCLTTIAQHMALHDNWHAKYRKSSG
jgi:hypothetical protein